MNMRSWLRDGWFVFFSVISLVMTVTLVMPAAFGFQNFTQWGGMYDEHWCVMHVYDKNPHTSSDARHEAMTVGDSRRVFSGPAHNKVSCAAAVQIYCGEPVKEGWTIAWIEPMLKGETFLGEQNACDPTLPVIRHWFFHAS